MPERFKIKEKIPEKTIEIHQDYLQFITEEISNHSRYPFLTLRLFLHILSSMDGNGQVHISARQLAARLDVHYDTCCKCLKFLREIGVLVKE